MSNLVFTGRVWKFGDLINTDLDKIKQVSIQDVHRISKQTLIESQSSVLYYNRKN